MKRKLIASLVSMSLLVPSAVVFSSQDLSNGIEVQAKYDFNFNVSGVGRQPIQIFTDGTKTWFQFGDTSHPPLIFANNKPIGYRLDGFLLVIDGVYPEINLFDAKSNSNVLVTYNGMYSTSSASAVYPVSAPMAINGVAAIPEEFSEQTQNRPNRLAQTKNSPTLQQVLKARQVTGGVIRKNDNYQRERAPQNLAFTVEPIEQIVDSPAPASTTKAPAKNVVVSPRGATIGKQVKIVAPVRKEVKPAAVTPSSPVSVEASPQSAAPVKANSAMNMVASLDERAAYLQEDNPTALNDNYQIQFNRHLQEDQQVKMMNAMAGVFVVEKAENVAQIKPVDVKSVKTIKVKADKSSSKVNVAANILNDVKIYIADGFSLILTGHAGSMNEPNRIARANARAVGAMKNLVSAGVSDNVLSVNKLTAHKNASDWSGVDIDIVQQ